MWKHFIWYSHLMIFATETRNENYHFPLSLSLSLSLSLFLEKESQIIFYFFSFSSYGQNLAASTQVVETLFSCLICLVGLSFFGFLIGNMQVHLLQEMHLYQKTIISWPLSFYLHDNICISSTYRSLQIQGMANVLDCIHFFSR